MTRLDANIIKPPATLWYWCLPDPQRRCWCTAVERLQGRDCGVQVPMPKPPKGQR